MHQQPINGPSDPYLLWKKESTEDGFIYANVLDFSNKHESWERQKILEFKHNFHYMKFDTKKCNKTSTYLRKKGNNFVDPKINSKCEKSYRVAIELYNESLRFAEPNTENVGWCYLNRSLLFYNLKKYDECIKDIQLARENKCPTRYKDELKRREKMALDGQKKGQDLVVTTSELTLKPHSVFPSMADVLELKYNEKYGRHIVATRDINVGERILCEKLYLSTFRRFDRTWCTTCLKPMKNFIPCPNCIDAMFCDEKCMKNNKIHEITCGVRFTSYTIKWFPLLLNSIISALITFDTVEQLMEFVEAELVKPKMELPTTCEDDKSKYAIFLKLHSCIKGNCKPGELEFLYNEIIKIPTINDRFNTLKKQRFLVHLIWQHHLLLTHGIYKNYPDTSGYVYGMGSLYSLISHSCLPNVHHQFYENKIICTSISKIKKGQQIFVIYSDSLWTRDYSYRQQILFHYFKFRCDCKRCTKKPRERDSQTMLANNHFTNTSILVPGYKFSPVEMKRIRLKENNIQFMQTFSNLTHTNELMKRIFQLTHCLNRDDPEYTKIPINYRILKDK